MANSPYSEKSPALCSKDRAVAMTRRMTLSMVGVWFFAPEAAMMCSTLLWIISATARSDVKSESRSDSHRFTLMSVEPS